MKRIILFALLFPAFILSGLWAVDYGAVLKGELYVEGTDETSASGSIFLAPWVSIPFDRAELYISAGLNTSISKEAYAAPEIFRLEFSFWRSSLFSFRVGRIAWQDPSQFIATGRFDGAEFLFNLGKIRLGANVLYTGLLFEDTAYINVSPTDTKDYSESFSWFDFADTYFAPRRLLASVYGEFPGFPSGRGHLYAGFIAQFDLSDAAEAFHTQYFLLRHSLVFKAFDLDVSGAAELEKTKADNVKPAFAFSIEGGFQLPTAMADKLSLAVAWASGKGSSTGAFFPITREAQSFVLQPILSGMMLIRLGYHARILPTLSVEAGAFYFIRTDSDSFTAAHLQNEHYALGMELNTGLLWVPFSDLVLSFKAGIFMPKTGSAWADDASVLWRITLGTVFSF